MYIYAAEHQDDAEKGDTGDLALAATGAATHCVTAAATHGATLHEQDIRMNLAALGWTGNVSVDQSSPATSAATHGATRCSPTHCNALQHPASQDPLSFACCDALGKYREAPAHCNIPQQRGPSTLQHTATCCNTICALIVVLQCSGRMPRGDGCSATGEYSAKGDYSAQRGGEGGGYSERLPRGGGCSRDGQKALCFRKRALYLRKGALYMHKRGGGCSRDEQKALCFRKRALYLRKGALCMHKRGGRCSRDVKRALFRI